MRKLIVRSFNMDILTQFAFAAASKDEVVLVSFSRNILVGHNSPNLPPFSQVAQYLLRNMAPGVHRRLEAVLAKRINVWASVQPEIKSLTPMINGPAGFTTSSSRRGGCPSFKLVGPQWSSLRNRAANAV